MNVLSVNELKSLCLQRKLPVSGTKAELIERLTKGITASRANSSTSSKGTDASPRTTTGTSSTPRPISATAGSSKASTTATATSAPPTTTDPSSLFTGEYESLITAQLKDLCRERMLPVGGIKDDLVARLNGSDPRKMSLLQLKDRCRDAGLPVTGTKSDLTERVMKNMTSGTNAILQSKSVDELKELCREHGAPVTGKKEDLIERIKQAKSSLSSKSKTKTSVESSSSSKAHASSTATKILKTQPSLPNFESMTVPQLKEVCRERNLIVGGTKNEILERLRQAPPAVAAPSSSLRPSSASSARSSATTTTTTATAATTSAATSTTSKSSYESMTIPQLKDLCRDRTLPVMGVKDELVTRLTDHDEIVRSMFKTPKTAATATGGAKRSASTTTEPKPKKKAKTISTTATTATAPAVAPKKATKAKKPSTSKPPQELHVARKSAPAPEPSMSGRYLVYSTCAYPRDNFHTYYGAGHPTYYESYDSVDAANTRVDVLFYGKNPWGLSRGEMDDLTVDERWDDATGLLRLQVCPPDSEDWVVSAQDRGAPAKDDDDVIMVSDSETEDEDHGFAY